MAVATALQFAKIGKFPDCPLPSKNAAILDKNKDGAVSPDPKPLRDDDAKSPVLTDVEEELKEQKEKRKKKDPPLDLIDMALKPVGSLTGFEKAQDQRKVVEISAKNGTGSDVKMDSHRSKDEPVMSSVITVPAKQNGGQGKDGNRLTSPRGDALREWDKNYRRQRKEDSRSSDRGEGRNGGGEGRRNHEVKYNKPLDSVSSMEKDTADKDILLEKKIDRNSGSKSVETVVKTGHKSSSNASKNGDNLAKSSERVSTTNRRDLERYEDEKTRQRSDFRYDGGGSSRRHEKVHVDQNGPQKNGSKERRNNHHKNSSNSEYSADNKYYDKERAYQKRDYHEKYSATSSHRYDAHGNGWKSPSNERQRVARAGDGYHHHDNAYDDIRASSASSRHLEKKNYDREELGCHGDGRRDDSYHQRRSRYERNSHDGSSYDGQKSPSTVDQDLRYSATDRFGLNRLNNRPPISSGRGQRERGIPVVARSRSPYRSPLRRSRHRSHEKRDYRDRARHENSRSSRDSKQTSRDDVSSSRDGFVESDISSSSSSRDDVEEDEGTDCQDEAKEEEEKVPPPPPPDNNKNPLTSAKMPFPEPTDIVMFDGIHIHAPETTFDVSGSADDVIRSEKRIAMEKRAPKRTSDEDNRKRAIADKSKCAKMEKPRGHNSEQISRKVSPSNKPQNADILDQKKQDLKRNPLAKTADGQAPNKPGYSTIVPRQSSKSVTSEYCEPVKQSPSKHHPVKSETADKMAAKSSPRGANSMAAAGTGSKQSPRKSHSNKMAANSEGSSSDEREVECAKILDFFTRITIEISPLGNTIRASRGERIAICRCHSNETQIVDVESDSEYYKEFYLHTKCRLLKDTCAFLDIPLHKFNSQLLTVHEIAEKW